MHNSTPNKTRRRTKKNVKIITRKKWLQDRIENEFTKTRQRRKQQKKAAEEISEDK